MVTLITLLRRRRLQPPACSWVLALIDARQHRATAGDPHDVHRTTSATLRLMATCSCQLPRGSVLVFTYTSIVGPRCRGGR